MTSTMITMITIAPKPMNMGTPLVSGLKGAGRRGRGGGSGDPPVPASGPLPALACVGAVLSA
jgi:hypothetical protein